MHPVAFPVGSFLIYWYGVLLALAFVAGFWTASRRAARAGLSPHLIADLGPWLILGTVVGARALYVLTYWREDFAGRPWWEVFMIRHGGLVFYGGFIGATLACVLFVRWKKLPLWKVADVLAPSVALGFAIGRLGCLMNGCCFGRACNLPWAIRFPESHSTHGAPVHPTQLYDFGWSLALYGGLAWLHRRKQFDGQVFAVFLAAYAVCRSVVELFRGDYGETQRLGWLTPAQLVSVVILVVAAALYWRLPRPTRE